MDIVRRGRLAVWGAMLLLAALPAAGQDSRAESDAVPGGPSPNIAVPSLVGESIATVSIVTRDEIQALGTDSVTEVLRMLPGLHVDEGGGRGGVSSLYMRGAEANYTVVLIDGVMVNDPTNSRGGSFDLSLLGTENIERIEVAHGPLPAAWGSAAIAGAVNIVTRKGAPDRQTSLAVAGSENGYYRVLAEANDRIGRFDYSLTFSRIDDAGVPIPGSEFESDTMIASLGYAVSDRIRARAHFRISDTERETYAEASGGPEFSPTRAVEERDTTWSLAGLQLLLDPTDWYSSRIEYGFFHQTEDLIEPARFDPLGINAPFPAAETDSDFTRNDITWRNSFRVSDWARVVAGAETLFERGKSDGFIDFFGLQLPTSFSLDRYSVAPFVEVDIGPIAHLRLQAGLRYDIPEDEDNELSPRIGVRYGLKSIDTVLRANWGRGFKLQSFFALGNPLVGDPARERSGLLGLEPETSQIFELGAITHLWEGKARVDATFFYSEFYDLIDFDPTTNLLVNRNTVVSQGGELAVAVQPLATFGVSGFVTYVDHRIENSHDELRNRPQWRGGLRMRWKTSQGVEASLNTVWVGTVHDFAVPVGEKKLDPYLRVDAALGWDLNSYVRVFFGVENLLDEDYEEFVGFPAQGITARIGMRLSL